MKKVLFYLTAIGLVFLGNGYAKAEVRNVVCYDSNAAYTGGPKNQIGFQTIGSLTKYTIYLNGKKIASEYTDRKALTYPYTIGKNSYVKIAWTSWANLLYFWSYTSGTTSIAYCD